MMHSYIWKIISLSSKKKVANTVSSKKENTTKLNTNAPLKSNTMAKIKDLNNQVQVSPTAFKAIKEQRTKVKMIPHTKQHKAGDIIEFVVFNDVEITGDKVKAKVIKVDTVEIQNTGDKITRIEFDLNINNPEDKLRHEKIQTTDNTTEDKN